MQRGSINEYAILLILIKEVDQSVLTALIGRLAGGRNARFRRFIAFLEFGGVATQATHIRSREISI